MHPGLTKALEGRYEIDREIGRGGMATVYLARDIRHQRHVALKFLDPQLGAVLGVERFLSEIQVTANLQHPNILPLFDSGEAEGLLFYVMPFVEGESLRARLDREKQLPADEAVRIATAVASALDYAHRHKVVHRDLKPENVLLQDGQPLIADFGIALAVSNAGGARITQTGLSLGTPQYMSPEQATGDRIVDGRSDIYSLGAITYEMLTGDPPHVASTTQAVIAKVLTERPPAVRTNRPSVAPHVEGAVMRALEKLAADRFATAREFADAISGRGGVPSLGVETPGAAPRRGARRWRRHREALAWSLAGVLAVLSAWRLVADSRPSSLPVIRSQFDLPPGRRINDVITGQTLAVAPRGDVVAFTTSGIEGFRIWLRRVNELTAREVSTRAGRNLAFSPDGRFLAFTEGTALYKVSVDGGEVSTVGSTGSAIPYGLAWGPGDTLFIGSFTGLYAIPANGGEARSLGSGQPGAREGQRWPIALPDGRTILFARGSSSTDAGRLAAIDLPTKAVTVFDLHVAMPLGVIDGQLVYVTPGGALSAVPFSGKPDGDAVQLEEEVLVDPTAGAKASLSASGTLAFLRGRAQLRPVIVPPGGAIPLQLQMEPGNYQTPRFSPDGRKIALTVFGSNATDIWIYDITRNTFTRLTTEGGNVRPEWTPDGKHVVFISARDGQIGIWQQPADGSGPATLLYQPEIEPFEALVSPDAKWLVVRTAPGARFSRDIMIVPLTGTDRGMTPLVSSPFTESMPRVSPDGRWLAYQSNESGRFQIYVRPFPGSGARVQVSDQGGTEPIWGRDGRTLYYRGGLNEFVAVRVTMTTELAIDERRVVHTGDYLSDSSHPDYDVDARGRMILLRRAGEEAQTVIVHNWARELREKTTRR